MCYVYTLYVVFVILQIIIHANIYVTTYPHISVQSTIIHNIHIQLSESECIRCQNVFGQWQWIAEAALREARCQDI